MPSNPTLTRTAGITFLVEPPVPAPSPLVSEFLVTLGSSIQLIDPVTGDNLITKPH